jgi:TPR repeat protein
MYVSTAAAQGSNCAAYNLGRALANGLHGMTVDTKEAAFWLKKAIGNCRHDHLWDGSKKLAQLMLEELASEDSSNSHSL